MSNGSFLQLSHPLLKESVDTIKAEPSIVIDCVIYDYDNSQYHLVYPGSGEITFSVLLNGYSYLEKYISLSEYKVVDTEANYSFTVQIGQDKVNCIPNLKLAILGQAILKIYDQGQSLIYPTQSSYINNQNNNIMISQFPGEFVFVKGDKERLTVIFKIVFENGNDDGVARVFIQELIDARKLVGLQGTPQVMFNKDIPLELKSYTSGQSSQSTGN